MALHRVRGHTRKVGSKYIKVKPHTSKHKKHRKTSHKKRSHRKRH